MTKPLKLAHLTAEQHRDIARLLNQAQDNLVAASDIISRAPYTDRTLFVGGTLQEWLINPLRWVWDEANPGRDFYDNPYQAVGYGGPHRRKKPPRSPYEETP